MRRRTHGRLLSWATLVIAASLCLSIAFPAVAVARSYSAQETAFVALINQYRAGNGLSTLLVSDLLSDAAAKHNADMAAYSFFSHTTLQSAYFAAGATPWDRMAACGYAYNTYKGENIAAGYSTAEAVFAGWKASAGHNQVMLTAGYKVIGISLLSAPGSVYGSYWTTDFGGYVDPTAHQLTTTTTQPVTTTTHATTTTTQRVTTTTQRATTTTQRATTTTQRVTTTTAPRYTTTTRLTTTTRPLATTTTRRQYTTTTSRFSPTTTLRQVSRTTTTLRPPR